MSSQIPAQVQEKFDKAAEVINEVYPELDQIDICSGLAADSWFIKITYSDYERRHEIRRSILKLLWKKEETRGLGLYMGVIQSRRK